MVALRSTPWWRRAPLDSWPAVSHPGRRRRRSSCSAARRRWSRPTVTAASARCGPRVRWFPWPPVRRRRGGNVDVVGETLVGEGQRSAATPAECADDAGRGFVAHGLAPGDGEGDPREPRPGHQRRAGRAAAAFAVAELGQHRRCRDAKPHGPAPAMAARGKGIFAHCGPSFFGLSPPRAMAPPAREPRSARRTRRPGRRGYRASRSGASPSPWSAPGS